MRDVFVLMNLYGYYADIFYKVDSYLNAYLISVPTSKKHVLFSFFFWSVLLFVFLVSKYRNTTASIAGGSSMEFGYQISLKTITNQLLDFLIQNATDKLHDSIQAQMRIRMNESISH